MYCWLISSSIELFSGTISSDLKNSSKITSKNEAGALLGPLRQTKDDALNGGSMDEVSSSLFAIESVATPNGRYVSFDVLIQMISAIRTADNGLVEGPSLPSQSKKLAKASMPTRMSILKYFETEFPKSMENLKSLKGVRAVKLSNLMSEQIDFTTIPETIILLLPKSRGTDVYEVDSNELVSPTLETTVNGPNDTSNCNLLIKPFEIRVYWLQLSSNTCPTDHPDFAVIIGNTLELSRRFQEVVKDFFTSSSDVRISLAADSTAEMSVIDNVLFFPLDSVRSPEGSTECSVHESLKSVPFSAHMFLLQIVEKG